MTDKTGGPAFPHPINPQDFGRGMTLRDYFAAKAMQGMMTNNEAIIAAATNKGLAKGAYEIADAMLKERGTP